MKKLTFGAENNICVGRYFRVSAKYASAQDNYWISKIDGNTINVSWDDESQNRPAKYNIDQVCDFIKIGSWEFIENEIKWKSRMFRESCNHCER